MEVKKEKIILQKNEEDLMNKKERYNKNDRQVNERKKLVSRKLK